MGEPLTIDAIARKYADRDIYPGTYCTCDPEVGATCLPCCVAQDLKAWGKESYNAGIAAAFKAAVAVCTEYQDKVDEVYRMEELSQDDHATALTWAKYKSGAAEVQRQVRALYLDQGKRIEEAREVQA